MRSIVEEIGRRLQARWRESGRAPGVLLTDDGDVLIVRADGLRSRIDGLWRRGNFFTPSQLRNMHRPATRREWIRWQNEALQALPPLRDNRSRFAAAIDELPHGIVRRSANGDVHVRTFQFEASLVCGRWYLGNAFTLEEHNAMDRIDDRAERAAMVTIARAALGVGRRDIAFV
jgi:hypothetical protein